MPSSGESSKVGAVTPHLQALYDEIVALAAKAPFEECSRRLRADFVRRCGKVDSDDPTAERREMAAWEDALVRGGLASEIAESFDDIASRRVARALASAVRGVFLFELVHGRLVARDLWSRAELLVVEGDRIGRELVVPGFEHGAPLCQARLLASLDGCVVLPGVLFHPAEALPALLGTLTVARERRLDTDGVLDALLRMEQRWRTLSRVKVRYAYRPEFLPAK